LLEADVPASKTTLTPYNDKTRQHKTIYNPAQAMRRMNADIKIVVLSRVVWFWRRVTRWKLARGFSFLPRRFDLGEAGFFLHFLKGLKFLRRKQ